MEQLKAITINKIDIDLEYGGDLLYHEGPLLSHYSNPQHLNEHYLYKWVDSDAQHNRWMIFKVLGEDLLSFFNEKVSLLSLIEKNSFCYLVDINEHLDINYTWISPVETLPIDYLPSKDSTFEARQWEDYALTLHSTLLTRDLLQTFEKMLHSIDSKLQKRNSVVKEFIASLLANDTSGDLKNYLQQMVAS